MKRIVILLFAVLLLFTACDRDKLAVITRDADGYGCTDTETGIHYTALPPAFEPAKTSTAHGVYTDEKTKKEHTYYEIPSQEPARYLADDEQTVWCADGAVPSADALTPVALLVCEDASVSVEIMRFSVANEPLTVKEILTLWFEGEAGQLPEGEMTYMRRIKMISEELPNIYYCFSLGVWGESTFLYDLFSGRSVEVPATLAEKFPKK